MASLPSSSPSPVPSASFFLRIIGISDQHSDNGDAASAARIIRRARQQDRCARCGAAEAQNDISAALAGADRQRAGSIQRGRPWNVARRRVWTGGAGRQVMRHLVRICSCKLRSETALQALPHRCRLRHTGSHAVTSGRPLGFEHDRRMKGMVLLGRSHTSVACELRLCRHRRKRRKWASRSPSRPAGAHSVRKYRNSVFRRHSRSSWPRTDRAREV